MTSPDRAALADSTDEEALALVMNVLQRIADTALEGFKGDTLDEATALSDINNFSRDTIDALAKRTMDSRTPPVRAALDKPTEAMVLAGGDVLLTACSSDGGQLNPWKPFNVAQVAIKVWIAMAALRYPSPYSGAAGEAVAWTNEAQLGFLKTHRADIPMAMWAQAPTTNPVALYAHPTLPRDAERDANRKDAEEFCKGAFGPFVTDVSQYVQIVTELLEHASNRASVSPRDAERETIERCAQLVTDLTLKHGRATGTDYEQGVQDHGYRLIHQIRALPSIPPPDRPGS